MHDLQKLVLYAIVAVLVIALVYELGSLLMRNSNSFKVSIPSSALAASHEGYSASLINRSAKYGYDATDGMVTTGGIVPRTMQSSHPSVQFERGPMV